MDVREPDMTECFCRVDGVELAADVFLPGSGCRNRAAVVFVHGGGWRGGQRQQFLWHAECLSRKGYVAATIDYRLVEQGIFPAALDDCQSAVQWLRREAARLEIETDRIGAMGSSAGGHLAACLGTIEALTDDGVSSLVNCVVDVHGVHDMTGIKGGKCNPICDASLGGTLEEQRERWIAASPALQVDGASAPMLLTHDPDDPTVPYEQSILMADALMRQGRPVQFMPTPGSGHGFVYSPQNAWTRKVWPVAVEWLDRWLNGAQTLRLRPETSV